MRYGTIVAAGLIAAVSVANAQVVRRTRIEVRPFAAAYVPSGLQGQDFGDASTFGLQGALELSSYAHVLASVGRTSTQTLIGGLGNKTQMWQMDLGAEFNALRPFATRYVFKPFIGVGAGLRSYKFYDTSIGSRSCGAGYGSLGSEVQRNAVAVRLEARGYLSCFKSPWSAERTLRDDMSIMFGIAYHIT